jgi:hypothetical protein
MCVEFSLSGIPCLFTEAEFSQYPKWIERRVLSSINNCSGEIEQLMYNKYNFPDTQCDLFSEHKNQSHDRGCVLKGNVFCINHFFPRRIVRY